MNQEDIDRLKNELQSLDTKRQEIVTQLATAEGKPGSTYAQKIMKRADFDRLPANEAMDFVKSGGRLED